MKPSTFLRAAGALALLAVLFHPRQVAVPPPPVQPCVAPLSQENALTDTDPFKGLPLAGGEVPTSLEKWQKKPPCNREAEEYEINGACWQATPRKPPCGAVLRAHRGGCYRPVVRVDPPPVGGGKP